ncbi:MAG TPA: hypothetical protein DC054_00970 [Blastocatellia bacterium]|nr:hypothetical protein [Blastocatellia bacterium]
MDSHTLDLVLQIASLLASAVSLVASVASLVLAAVAILLSYMFFRLSAESSNGIQASTHAIDNSVTQLDRLFELLHTETFQIVRGTISAYEKRFLADPAIVEESEQLAVTKTNEKIEQFKADMRTELETAVAKFGKTEAQLSPVRQQLEKVLDMAIDGSLNADREAREENIKDHLLSYLNELSSSDSAMPVMKVALHFRDRFRPADILKALIELKQDGRIDFDRKIDHWSDISGDVMLIRTNQRPQSH